MPLNFAGIGILILLLPGFADYFVPSWLAEWHEYYGYSRLSAERSLRY